LLLFSPPVDCHFFCHRFIVATFFVTVAFLGRCRLIIATVPAAFLIAASWLLQKNFRRQMIVDALVTVAFLVAAGWLLLLWRIAFFCRRLIVIFLPPVNCCHFFCHCCFFCSPPVDYCHCSCCFFCSPLVDYCNFFVHHRFSPCRLNVAAFANVAVFFAASWLFIVVADGWLLPLCLALSLERWSLCAATAATHQRQLRPLPPLASGGCLHGVIDGIAECQRRRLALNFFSFWPRHWHTFHPHTNPPPPRWIVFQIFSKAWN